MYPWEFLVFICHITHEHFEKRKSNKKDSLATKLELMLPLFIDPSITDKVYLEGVEEMIKEHLTKNCLEKYIKNGAAFGTGTPYDGYYNLNAKVKKWHYNDNLKEFYQGDVNHNGLKDG